MHARHSSITFVLISLAAFARAQSPDDAFDYAKELAAVSTDLKLGKAISALEEAKSDPAPADSAAGLVVRSRHLIFGLPRLIDNRYAQDGGKPGVSLIVREGFVIAYSDSMHCPIWVAQRWTTHDLHDLDRAPNLKRDWKEDPDLPAGLHVGTGYSGNATALDRGHMARHEMNRAWGLDASIEGCLMTNSVPQHKDINRGPAWRALEDAIRDHVAADSGPELVEWVISGALFRDTDNPPNEAPDADLKKSAEINGGFHVPYATFKIVAWFDSAGNFQARGYIFEQPYTVHADEALKASDFALPSQNRDPKEFIRPIDEIETRSGVDFFPLLKDAEENKIEAASPSDMWGN